MNTLRVTVTVDSLAGFTPTGADTYDMIAKFFKLSDGSPLGDSHIPNEQTISVTAAGTTFQANIPIENASYSTVPAQLLLLANDEADCCNARLNFEGGIVNTETTVSVEAVLMSGLGNNKVYRYEPSTNNTIQLMEAISSPDIAHTSSKLFVANIATGLQLKEYNITLSPFTQSFSRNYELGIEYYGPGLHAVSNTELYIANENVYKITITGTVAAPTLMFALPSGYQCTGDLIFDPATNLFLIIYDNGTDYRIGVFQSNGTLVRSATVPVNNMFGIYQYSGNTFVIDGTGQIYSLNLSTLATVAGFDTNTGISGGSQIQSNISIPA